MAREVIKKVTLNIPEDVLRAAQAETGTGITSTILEGLEELRKRKLRRELSQLRGKVKIDLSLDRSRR